MAMTSRVAMGTIFIVLVVILLVTVYYRSASVDGFVNYFDEGTVPLGGNCGTDAQRAEKPYAPCEGGNRCVNGYCKSDSPVPLPEITPLPIRPDRYTVGNLPLVAAEPQP
jgi:hypothetical protein